MVRLTIEKPERQPDVLTFEEPAEMTIGRCASCDYVLDFDPMVSRMHAVVLIDPPSVRIKDLNSTNGLTINGEVYGALSNQKIIQPLELRDGDEVRIGATVIRVNLVDDSAPTARVGQSDTLAVGTEQGRINSSFVEAESAPVGQAAQSPEETVTNLASVPPSVPGYSIVRPLGEGHMGNVYLAVANNGGKTVALKIISPAITFSKKMLDDFRREAAMASRVQHPNIAQLFGTGEIGNGGVFMAMEYVNGENLTSYLQRCPNRRIPLHNAYNLMLQLANALCHVHRQGFVHMDLKPGSVMLYDDNGRLRAKITDMGYAHLMDDTGIAPRGFAGSGDLDRLSYLPPEEVNQVGEAKTTADVFSLSAMFYEMLTGRVPYNFTPGGNNKGVVADADMMSIEEAMPGLPEPLVVIIERGLSTDPEARYQNCCDLLEALENVWV